MHLRLIVRVFALVALLISSSGSLGFAQTLRWKPDERVHCVREAAGVTVTKTLELRGPLPNRVGAIYRIFGGTATIGVDYDGSSFVEVFTTLNDNTRTEEVQITVLDDVLAENNESVRLVLEVYDGVELEGPPTAQITIVDDEASSVGDLERCLAVENFDDLYFQNTATRDRWSPADREAPFELSLTNYGTAPRHNVRFVQTVPVYTRFDTQSSPGWVCPNGDGENAQCFLDVGTIGRGETATAEFSTRVQETTANTVEIYSAAAAGEADPQASGGSAEEAASARSSSVQRFVVPCPICVVEEILAASTDDAEKLCIIFFGLLQYATVEPPPEPPSSILRHLVGSVRQAVTLGYEAGVLYRLRDRVLRDSPGGRRALELFYGNVATITDAAARAPGYYLNVARTANLWFPALFSVTAQDGSALVTQDMVGGFRDFFEDLYPYAPSAFDNEAREQLTRLDLQSWVGQPIRAAVDGLAKLSCEPSAETLCLNGGRFRVEVAWQDFQGGAAHGRAEQLTLDTGSFWFFAPENVELIVKVLDARGVNGHYWVFYGALSNVAYELTVTDTLTGQVRVYENTEGTFASVGDTAAFVEPLNLRTSTVEITGLPADRGLLGSAPSQLAPLTGGVQWPFEGKAEHHGSNCSPSLGVLCLGAGRFEVRVDYIDFQGGAGSGKAAPMTDDTGSFWFFEQENIELVVKVLDARGVNGHYWVYYGALSNVQYELTVTDTLTGQSNNYFNSPGTFASDGDVSAFSE